MSVGLAAEMEPALIREDTGIFAINMIDFDPNMTEPIICCQERI